MVDSKEEESQAVKNDASPAKQEGFCLVGDYDGLRQIVVPSNTSGCVDVQCYKKTELVIENMATKKRKTLPKYFISMEPPMSLILDILEPGWVDHLLKVGESRWTNSQTSRGLTTSHPSTYSTQESKTRRSQSVVFRHAETDTIAHLEHRVALIAGLDVGNLENLVMVKYEPGDYFKDHHDGPFRSHTVLLYLNDVDGGETVFPNLKLAVKPVANSALYWRNITADGLADFSMVHAGTSPRSGMKYVVNCFFNVERVRR